MNIFHTAPTTIRMLRKLGPGRAGQVQLPLQDDDDGRRADRARRVALVLRRRRQGRGRDHRHVVADRERRLPGQHAARAAADEARQLRAGRARHLPGDLRRERRGGRRGGSGKAGNICIRNPWPGIFQTIWGQPERFVDTYYAKYCRDKDSKDWHDWPYFAGDGAVQAADGYFRILGRVDDVINVAGHRLGTKELESASITVEEIAEAAAVPVIDELRGKIVEMYVALKPGFTAEQGDRAEGAATRSTGRSGRSRAQRTCGSSPTCRRPARARSCAG